MKVAERSSLLLSLLWFSFAHVVVSSSLDFVLTPGGYKPRECVHEVPSGSFVARNGDDSYSVITPLGNEITYKPCRNAPPQHGAAWKAWAQYDNSLGVTNFHAEWPVPPAPSLSKGQTLFYWNGVEPKDTSEVFQPVLQWGSSAAGGGNYWALASWFVSDKNSFWSGLLSVTTGDTILGDLTFSKNQTWTVVATSASQKKGVQIVSQHVTVESTAYVVLEAYNIQDCNQYPAKTQFVPFVKLQLFEGFQPNPVTPSWQVMTKGNTCNEHAQVVSPSEVDIYNPH